MANSALVEGDIIEGREFLSLLDSHSFDVKGAFWLYSSDNDRWRLNIVTPLAAKGSKDLYLKAISLNAKIDMSKVQFIKPDAPIFKALGTMARISGVSGVRMTSNVINGIYVEDAYAYRLMA